MGNIVSSITDEDETTINDSDLEYISLNITDALFNTSYMTNIITNLPIYPTTEIETTSSEAISWDSEAWYFKNLFSEMKNDINVSDFEVSKSNNQINRIHLYFILSIEFIESR